MLRNVFRSWFSRLAMVRMRRAAGRGPRTQSWKPRFEVLDARDVPSGGATPVGTEFQVNTYVTADQRDAAVASDATGDFVVAWRSYGQPGGSQYGVYAQRYNADGSPNGAEFQVNTNGVGFQGRPLVAMNAGGDFVVTWISYADGDSAGISAQLYAAGGTPVGTEIQVNTNTGGFQFGPSVAIDAAGDFLIAWTSYDGDGRGVSARLFDITGAPATPEFTVNATTAADQTRPAVGTDSAGNFVVAWRGTDADGYGVFAQRFAVGGTPAGPEFAVNAATADSQDLPSVAVNATGDFVVAWRTSVGLGGSDVYARRFAADGTPVAPEFLVNTTTADEQSEAKAAIAATGDFVIAWQSDQQDGSGRGIYLQQYAADGTPVGTETQVNTSTSGNQGNPSVAMDAAGDFVVAWNSDIGDGDQSGIFAQRYAAPPANQAPGIEVFNDKSYVDGSAPLLLAPGGSITDADSLDFDGGKLTVQLTGGVGTDRLGIRTTTGVSAVTTAGGDVLVGGTEVGTFSGGTSGTDPLVITFNADSSPAAAHAILRAITYRNVSTDPTSGGANLTRTATFTVDDGDGGSNSDVKTINVADRPDLGGIATATFTEDAGPIALAPAGTVADGDSANFDGGTLKVQVVAKAQATDRLTVRNKGTNPGEVGFSGGTVTFGGTPVGTATGGTGSTALLITFNTSASQAAVQAVLQNLTFANVSQNPSTLARTVRYTLSDGDGQTSAAANQTVNLVAVNDPPVVNITGSIGYTEGGAAVVLAPFAGLSDTDTTDLTGGSLTVTVASGGVMGDILAIKTVGTGAGQISESGGTVKFGNLIIGNSSGGTEIDPLVVTFTGNASVAAVRALLKAITYQNISGNPTNFGASPTRSIELAVADGNGGTGTAAKAVTVTAVNSKPVLSGITAATYLKADPATRIAENALVADPDSADFAFGKLTVKATANGAASDRFEIQNQGTDPGQVGVSGGNVTYGGTVIGTVTGGTGTTPLVVTFNASATRDAVQAVLRAVTYRNTNANPTVLTRTIRYTLGDGDGGVSDPVDQMLDIV